MIQVNELRVGNWLLGEDGDLFQVEELTPIIKDYKFRWEWLKNVRPIPLTPMALQKCGFVKVPNGIGLTVFEGYVKICSLFTGIPLTLEIDGNRMPLRKVTYLHELQNLYFALTGEELKTAL